MKKFLTVLLAVLMVLSASGCSRNQNNVEVANKDKPAADKDGT